MGAESLYRDVRAKGHAVAGAEWIWSPEELPRGPRPTSFFAARDFYLPSVPDQARLLIVADEEYRLTLNGRFLGGNRYWLGMPMDRFDVSEVLRTGSNRIVVQLRSERGGGGLLASLSSVEADGGGKTLLQTDTSWVILPRVSLAEIRGWRPLQAGEKPRSWGRAPVGRWGIPQIGPQRQLPALLEAPAALPPKTTEASPSVPADLLLDWGRPVIGYLNLELAEGSPRLGKIVYADHETFSVEDSRAVAVVLGPGETRWRDARPQRFRYARVQGFDDLTGAFVDIADDRELPEAAPADTPSGFKVWAPPLVTPTDAAVRHAQEGR